MAHTVKNLPAMQETQVRALGQEDPVEKGMATEKGMGYSCWGHKDLDATEQLPLSLSLVKGMPACVLGHFSRVHSLQPDGL